jgi:hypothetical protein
MRVFAFGSEGIAIGLTSRYAPVGDKTAIIDLVLSNENGKFWETGLGCANQHRDRSTRPAIRSPAQRRRDDRDDSGTPSGGQFSRRVEQRPLSEPKLTALRRPRPRLFDHSARLS